MGRSAPSSEDFFEQLARASLGPSQPCSIPDGTALRAGRRGGRLTSVDREPASSQRGRRRPRSRSLALLVGSACLAIGAVVFVSARVEDRPSPEASVAQRDVVPTAKPGLSDLRTPGARPKSTKPSRVKGASRSRPPHRKRSRSRARSERKSERRKRMAAREGVPSTSAPAPKQVRAASPAPPAPQPAPPHVPSHDSSGSPTCVEFPPC